MEEFEVKFLKINVAEIESKLTALGAKKEFDKIYKRKTFDHPDMSLNKMGAYLRLRDEGDKVTMAYKRRLGMKEGKNDAGLEEIEITVSDFEKTAQIILKTGLVEKFYEENRRIRYILGDSTFDIDFWPLLDPFLEIEGKSWDEVEKGIALLGLNSADKKIFPAIEVYRLNGLEELDYKILTFEQQVKR
ncbi:MAG TPA: class IV adenylate cyclase [Candidatus Saccharimonadales bacterium]|nr:class IV adenylate cyclase [Candidatus Saccharimonadales bacterium]